MDIFDAHQHFWDIDANYLPWLRDMPPINFRYGDYGPLRRNYLPADYRCDAGDFTIVGSLFIETEWDPRDPLGEVAWVSRLKGQSGLPSAMVAQAWLHHDDAETVLERYAATPLVKGVRHKPRAVAQQDAVEPGVAGSMGDPAWRRGFACLAGHGLSFDLQTPWWHLREARALADDFGETAIILNHAGLPADRSQSGLAAWREALVTFAAAPNVSVKISGLGVRGRPWTIAGNEPVVRTVIDIFGPERVMFASNFPVDSLVAAFETIFSGFEAMTRGFAQTERHAMFCGNAQRIYRVPPAQ